MKAKKLIVIFLVVLCVLTTMGATSVSAMEAPEAPINLKADALNTFVSLSWDTADLNAKGYNLYRDGVKVYTLGNVTSFVDMNLINGKTYVYKVTTVNQDGIESGFSNEVKATPFLLNPTIIGDNLKRGDTISFQGVADPQAVLTKAKLVFYDKSSTFMTDEDIDVMSNIKMANGVFSGSYTLSEVNQNAMIVRLDVTATYKGRSVDQGSNIISIEDAVTPAPTLPEAPPVNNSTVSGSKPPTLTTLKPIRVTSDQGMQGNPDIYEDNVVFLGGQVEKFDIYLYNVKTKKITRLTNNASSKGKPVIYNDKVVYSDIRNGNKDIFLYDLPAKREIQITTNPAEQDNPDIYGNIIVWDDNRNGMADVYMYDLVNKKETCVTSQPGIQKTLPKVYGDRIIWVDSRDELNDHNVYMYEISTGKETKLISRSGDQSFADIFEDKIAYVDNSGGYYKLYLYDLATQSDTRIAYGNNGQSLPRIFKNTIVWECDWSPSDSRMQSKVLMYDLETGLITQITNESVNGRLPAVYGGTIVWEQFGNDYNHDIYMLDLNAKYNITMQIGKPHMMANGKKIEIDLGRGTSPVLFKAKAMIPIRAFVEEVGGTVEWNTLEQKVTVRLKDKIIELWLDKNMAKVNGEDKFLEVAPKVINGRTMIPLRFIGENLGFDVSWEQATKTITLIGS